jgi:glycosyltransferase involved in cell wall biosynthesis
MRPIQQIDFARRAEKSEIAVASSLKDVPVAAESGLKSTGNATAVEDADLVSDLETSHAPIELSVVIPCLNEAETIGACVATARRALSANNICGEVIVADNGSFDGSADIALKAGACLVNVSAPGYGNALMAGIEAARGEFIIMGDADGSYDFNAIPDFLNKLREGFDLVQGCRLPTGGGTIIPGAMPFLHRHVGNPLFSFLARRWFSSSMHDVYCGLRGFTKSHFRRLEQRCTGMEFATEMIIKSCMFGAEVAEVPVVLHPDGRSRAPHLRTFRDGWRTLRFFLVCSPRRLFLIPGYLLIAFGLIAYGLALPGIRVGGVIFDAHTLLFGTVALLCGYQAIFFGIFAKALGAREGILPEDKRVRRLLDTTALEVGLATGALALAIGVVLLLGALNQWRVAHFGALQYAHTMRWVVPGTALTALGFQTILSAFLLSILRLRRE